MLSILLHGVILAGIYVAIKNNRFDFAAWRTGTGVPVVIENVQIVGDGPGPVIARSETAPLRSRQAEQPPNVGNGIEVSMAGIVSQGNLPPRYPRLAEERGWEGTVKLRVRAGEDQNDVEIVESSSFPVLDEAAVTSARKWKLPAGDEKISFVIPVEFSLKD